MSDGIPLTVSARLAGPVAGWAGRPVMFDGPLSWAAAMDAHAAGVELPPLTRAHAPDMDIPLAIWHEHGVWGWCASDAHYSVVSHTAVEVRRKPDLHAMARFSTANRHHIALGPHKARDLTIPAAWITAPTWHVLTTDRGRLERLLGHLTHLGENVAIGLGAVTEWAITESTDRGGWRDRPLPATHPTVPARAPYWHPTRRVGELAA